MSDTGPVTTDLPPTNEPLRIAVRRMRWFRTAFAQHVAEVGTRIGCDFAIDEAVLAEVFVRWLRAVERQKPSDKTERKAFFEFAAGFMLRELCATMPITAKAAPTKAGVETAAFFWPEGYACTTFCLTVHAAAMEQEFMERPEVAPAIDDLRQWWSFRENQRLDQTFPVGFLQMLLGHQPNWTMPDVFRVRIREGLSNGT